MRYQWHKENSKRNQDQTKATGKNQRGSTSAFEEKKYAATHSSGADTSGIPTTNSPNARNINRNKSANYQHAKMVQDTESTVSSTRDEPTITQEPGTYLAIPVKDYRDGPIEEIAVHHLRINRVIENKAIRNRQQEENIQTTELDCLLYLETLIKETAADPELIEVQSCLEDNSTLAFLEDYKHVAKKLTHSRGITIVDDRIIVSKLLWCLLWNPGHEN